MGDFDFILDGIRFSYSSASTYNTCPYSFKLTYIDYLPRENNFYAEYGTLIHEVIEQYFNGNIDIFELTKYYEDNYDRIIKTSPPAIPPNLEQRYKESGREFFDNFSFERSKYDILLIEDKIEFVFDEKNKVNFTARPDLVLRNKETGVIGLYDYKSSAPFRTDKRSGKEIVDKEKLEGYYKQSFIYAYALRNYHFMPIDEITIWFTRPSRMVTFDWNIEKEQEAIKWLEETIDKIKKDDKFLPNTSSPYFCENLCSVRNFCEYR